jgi:hypothetical protein
MMDWLDNAAGCYTAAGTLSNKLLAISPSAASQIKTICDRIFLSNNSTYFHTSRADIVNLIRCTISWAMVVRQQPKPEGLTTFGTVVKPVDFTNDFTGLLQFKTAVERLALLDSTCSSAMKLSWKRTVATITKYCHPSLNICEASGVFLWFQELLATYELEVREDTTYGVSPHERSTFCSLRDSLGKVALKRDALDNAVATRQALLKALSSPLYQAAIQQAAASAVTQVAKTAAGGKLLTPGGAKKSTAKTVSPPYIPPQKKKDVKQEQGAGAGHDNNYVPRPDFHEWLKTDESRDDAGDKRCFEFFTTGRCRRGNACEFVHA